MIIRDWEWINVILASLLTVAAFRRDIRILLLLLFVYGTLHFAWAGMPVLTGASSDKLQLIHTEGSGFLANASVSLVLLVVFFRLQFSQISNSKDEIHKRIFQFAVVALVVGYMLNLREGDWLQFRNVVILVYMLILLYLATQSVKIWRVPPNALILIIILLLAMVVFSFYEIYTLSTWAVFNDSLGRTVYRPSAMLFNPNLYALWCALIALTCACLFHSREKMQRLMLGTLALSMVGIYLSGSRSFAIALLMLLAGAALMIKNQSALRKWTPTLMMPMVFALMWTIAEVMINLSREHSAGWSAIALLGERFALAPIYILNYSVDIIQNSTGWFQSFEVALIPIEVADSIEGRFGTGLRDAGWLVVYDDTGWLGIIGMLSLWAWLGAHGVLAYYRNRDVTSVYAIAAFALSVATGVVMRFQVFPTSLFVLFMVAPPLSYWRSISIERTQAS